MADTSIWVEILPADWPDWRHAPYGVRVGRVRKRQPKPHERHLYREIVIPVDMGAVYGPVRTGVVGNAPA